MHRPAARAAGTRLSQVEVLACGVGWGIVVCVLESTAFALTRENLRMQWPVLCALLLIWSTRGVGLAWSAMLLGSRLRASRAWSLFPVIAAMLALAWDGTDWLAGSSRRWLAADLPYSGQFLFTLGPALIYGAPLFAYCVADGHARRGRLALQRAQAAYLQNVVAIDEARLELASRRIDSSRLLESLLDVREAIADGRHDALARMDELVAWLRASVGGVQGGPHAWGFNEATEVDADGSQ